MFCKTLILILVGNLTWDFSDLTSLQTAAKGCAKSNQCLSEFHKKEETHYHAECKYE